MVEFKNVFRDSTKYARKIKKGDYLNSGVYPIVDQGQEFVIGYTNDEKGLFTDVPAIIFGDHTRIIKYIDKPFFIGADGVKVLKSKLDDVDYKYLYYALRKINIINNGYNRHFKWLKESKFNLPNLKTQQKISTILDIIESIIDLKTKQLSDYDQLVKSRFVEMFGDPVSNPMDWDKLKCKKIMTKIGSGATPRGGNQAYKEEGISLIRSMNVHNDRFS
jgi:type I restriction enzyme, S subunit